MNPDVNVDNELYNSFDEPKQTKIFLDLKASWSGNLWLFGKSVSSSDAWLGTQVKGWLAEADEEKNVVMKQTQVKGCCDTADMWKDAWSSVHMTTDSGSPSIGGLLCLAILR